MFWGLTPRLYAIHMSGARRRLDRQARDTAWAVWHVAALGRAKKLPSLEKFVPQPAPLRSSVTPWQAQLAGWRAYSESKQRGR